MGNCHRSNFHIIEEEQKSVTGDKLNSNLLQLLDKNNTYLKKDQMIEFIEKTINPRYFRDMAHFKRMFRIKKNFKCQKDLLYDIKVIQNIRSGRLFNLKIITKEGIKFIDQEKFRKMFSAEMRVLQTVIYRNVESLVNVYIDRSLNEFKLYIVTNYTTRFTLHDEINKRIQEKKRFSNSEVASMIKFFAEILLKFQSEKLVYRNFSPQNIFFVKEGNLQTLCVRNFYFSVFIESDTKIRGMTGPLWFMAPEMLQDTLYDGKVDIWACGLIIYTFLTLENPLTEYTTKNQIAEIIKTNKCFKKISSLVKYGIDENALDLTYKMLVEEPQLRISPDFIFEAKYFKELSLTVDKDQFVKLLNSFDWKIVEKLKFKIKNLKVMHNINFCIFFNLKHYFIDIEERILIGNFFDYLNYSKDGILKKSEIEKNLLNDHKLFGRNNITQYMEILDILLNNDLREKEFKDSPYLKDTVYYEHFIVTCIILRMYCNKDQEWVKKRVKMMYNELDSDASNSISLDEIQNAFHEVPSNDYLRNNLKILISDSFYNPVVIRDFNDMSLSDIQNLLFYECIILSEEQKEM
jgi:serine/threonine protein kinase